MYQVWVSEDITDVCSQAKTFAVQDNEAYKKLRIERTNAKLMGKRAKRVAEAAAEEKEKAK